MTTVILTEKNDQAKKIAEVLNARKVGRNFEGTFQGQPLRIVTASGHLVRLSEPDEIIPELGWNNPQKLIPIPRVFDLKPGHDSPGTPAAYQPRSHLKNIREQLKGATKLILATDADREGEAIGWTIMDILGYHGPVVRAWLSAGLDKKSIQDAFSNLRPPEMTKSWYRAAEARNRSDWAYMFLVRAYTHYSRYGVFGKNLGFGKGAKGVMSVGRVQTPALAMIVRRDQEIENFVSTDHFLVSAVFNASSSQMLATYKPIVSVEIIDNRPPGVTWESGFTPNAGDGEDANDDTDVASTGPLDRPLYTDKTVVDGFTQRLKSVGVGIVSSYQTRERLEHPPKTFSLTDAQKVVSKACNISAELTQTILEDLYEQGWTSYARTAKSALPENFYLPEERNGLLGSLFRLPETTKAARYAAAIHNGEIENCPAFMPKVFTKKALEHHGIIPTQQVMTPEAFAKLSPAKKTGSRIAHTKEHMQTAYLCVAKQFIQVFFPPARYNVQEAYINVNTPDILGHATSRFHAKGEVLTRKGWRAAFNAQSEKDTSIPECEAQERLPITDIPVKAAKTKPPQRYTQITFPKEMENVGRHVADPELRKRLKNSEGIGTPATRKSIIQTLIVRGYIKVSAGKYYSEQKGKDLIAAIPTWLSSPETTAIWEDYLVKLCEIKDDAKAISIRDQFSGKQIDRLERLIGDLNNQYHGKLGAKTNVGGGTVSSKMKNAIKSVAKQKGIEIPKGALVDYAKAKAFLDENLGGENADTTPSEKQLAMANSIIENMLDKPSTDENTLKDRKACSAFIDAHKQFLPPSDKMSTYAKKLISQLPPDRKATTHVLRYAGECSAFIDSELKRRKGLK